MSARPSGRPPCSTSAVDEQVEGADAAGARRGLERLEPDADERRREPCADGGRDPLGGADRVGVLDVVAANAVAVLEVDAEVLDRLALELLAHARCDGRGDALVEPDRDGQRLEPARRVGGGERGAAPLDRELGREPVGGHVDGVHGLPRSVVAGIRGREQPVGRVRAVASIAARATSERAVRTLTPAVRTREG